MKYDVFVSHSSKDQKEVNQIVQYLESNNFVCFVSYRDIPHSQDWADILVNALEESRCVVYIHTQASNDSAQIIREVQIAVDDLKKPFITYRLTDEDFKGGKKYFLQTLNWIDSLHSAIDGLPLLAKTIQATLDGVDVESEKQEFKPVRKPFPKSLTIALLSLVSAAILGTGGFFTYKTIKEKQAQKLQSDYQHYCSYVSSAKKCIGNIDSVLVFEPYLSKAEAISEVYKENPEAAARFNVDMRSLRKAQKDTLSVMIEPLIQQINGYFDLYTIFPGEELKNDINKSIHQIETIHKYIGTQIPESISLIKTKLQ